MGKIFDTQYLDEDLMRSLPRNEVSWIYNGLDCCITAEVFAELSDQLRYEPESVRETYQVALDKGAPIMEMSLRGTLIHSGQRAQSIKELEADLARLDGYFQRIMREVFGQEVNWNSPAQLKDLFYGWLQLKEVKSRNAKGQYVATTNSEALESFRKYLYVRPIANLVLALRDINKQLGFLKTKLDPDGRMRTSYNIAGTNTGRLASAMSDFGTGTNLQNVNRKLRYPFVADPGMYLLNIDLEQADGRNVGARCHQIFFDTDLDFIRRYLPDYDGPTGAAFASAYLDACESGDLHTTVCHMTWPELDWPEDPAEWKEFCDGFFMHGQDSPRQLSKKLGHGTNFYGKPVTMAKHTHTPKAVIEDFQNRYFGKFPCIPAWQAWVIDQIKTTGTLYNLFGRRRMFWGRANDASTHRKAIAYDPQSSTGEEIDRGLLAVWRKFPQVQLLNQVHDSILFQLPLEAAEELVPQILETMRVPLTLAGGREFCVPLDAAGGWNWGYADKKLITNPYGLMKWKGNEQRLPPNDSTRLKALL